MISRSFYFFFLIFDSINISKFFFKNINNISLLKNLKIGFYFFSSPKLNDMRLILSFFVLKTLFNNDIFIRKFNKKIVEVEGKKTNKILYCCELSIYNIYKYLFFDFFLDSMFSYIGLRLNTLINFSRPDFKTFICLFKHSNFIPFFNEDISLYNVYFCFKFLIPQIYLKNYTINILDNLFKFYIENSKKHG